MALSFNLVTTEQIADAQALSLAVASEAWGANTGEALVEIGSAFVEAGADADDFFEATQTYEDALINGEAQERIAALQHLVQMVEDNYQPAIFRRFAPLAKAKTVPLSNETINWDLKRKGTRTGVRIGDNALDTPTMQASWRNPFGRTNSSNESLAVLMDKAQKIFLENDKEYEYRMTGRYGLTPALRSAYEEAQALLKKAFEIALKQGDKLIAAIVMEGLAKSFGYLEERKKATAALGKASSLYEEAGNMERAALTLFAIRDVLQLEGHSKMAAVSQRLSILWEAAGNTNDAISAAYDAMECWKKAKNQSKTEEAASRARALSRKLTADEIEIRLVEMRKFIEENQIENAIWILKTLEFIEGARASGALSLEKIIGYKKERATLLEKTGEYQEAIGVYEELLQLVEDEEYLKLIRNSLEGLRRRATK